MELQRVLEAYRAMAPVRHLIELIKAQFDADCQWASLEVQAQVMQVVIHDKVCEDFAPLKKYTYNFLKTYVEAIESEHASLDDGLVESLMEYVQSPQWNEDTLNAEAMHYVSYTIPSIDKSVVVTCRVASVINEVGLKVWEASSLLAEYIIAYQREFRDKKVLELGAGVGLTGIVLACVCHSRSLVLTDYAPNVMQNLRYNVEINSSYFCCPVQVQALDWETWEPHDDKSERPDVLIAGDCAYDVAAFPHFMRVLQIFLAHKGAERPQPLALVAATIRNEETFQEFLDQLAAHEIEYKDITATSLEKMGTPIFCNPNRAQIRICRLSKLD